MDRKAKKIIFFDFDGVIADSFSGAFEVSKMIHPLLEPEDYRKRFHGNINDTVVDTRVQKEHHPEIDFFEHYGPVLIKSPVFPGMKDTLKTLHEKFTLVIISSTTTGLIANYLKFHGMDAYFKEVMGNDVHTSKIKKMGMALEKYHAAPDDCWFITDTLGDILEANHVGIQAVAVTWGYNSRKILEQGHPSHIVDTTEALLNALT